MRTSFQIVAQRLAIRIVTSSSSICGALDYPAAPGDQCETSVTSFLIPGLWPPTAADACPAMSAAQFIRPPGRTSRRSWRADAGGLKIASRSRRPAQTCGLPYFPVREFG